MDKGEWIASVSVLLALGALLRGYLTTSTFVPTKRATELSSIVIELRTEIAGLRGQVVELKNQVSDLMREGEFWRDQYRTLKGNGRRSLPRAEKEP
jgi:hypothetical protein